MRPMLPLAVCIVGLVAGCPPQDTSSAVDPQISVSAPSGDAPFTLSVSGAGSTSANGGPLTYAWDFDDGSTSSEMALSHTYANPGRYTVALRVTDPLGDSAVATQEIRVRGTGAVAVIQASTTSGPRPLTVQFDGTHSQVGADTVYDYFWDFGDGATSRAPDPQHTFNTVGAFTVRLQIETGGGLQAETTTVITVGARVASLQFGGAQLATLPLAGQDLSSCTFEAWVKPDAPGGTVASIGSGTLVLEVLPQVNAIRLSVRGVQTSATATSLAGAWQHFAVRYGPSTSDPNNPTSTCAVLFNGAPLTSLAATGSVSATGITLGSGMQGKIGEVRFWAEARTNAEILASRDERVTGNEPNLIGAWHVDEGTGQTLNNAAGGTDGVLGTSTATENADPAWSTEGPPVD